MNMRSQKKIQSSCLHPITDLGSPNKVAPVQRAHLKAVGEFDPIKRQERQCCSSHLFCLCRRLMENSDPNCTACPSDYVPRPTPQNRRRCILPETSAELTGVSCGSDTGLGSVWEANLRMPGEHLLTLGSGTLFSISGYGFCK